jgi:hypothetical protein
MKMKKGEGRGQVLKIRLKNPVLEDKKRGVKRTSVEDMAEETSP